MQPGFYNDQHIIFRPLVMTQPSQSRLLQVTAAGSAAVVAAAGVVATAAVAAAAAAVVAAGAVDAAGAAPHAAVIAQPAAPQCN